MKRFSKNVLRTSVAAVLVAGSLAACSSSSGGTPTLTWYINPDNGSQATLATECTTAAQGKYKIKTQILPNDASLQRQQLVTRLAAKDSSIDMMSLDPVFVAEFAEAGFLNPVPTADASTFTTNIVKPAVQASTWKGKLVAAPFWANTQLLWYRKSLAAQAGLDMTRPVTWDQIIAAAQKLHKAIGVQSKLYEGYMVWINALIAGAGGQIVENPGEVANNLKLGIDSPAGEAAAAVIQKLASAGGVGGPAMSSSDEGAALALFEAPATSMFMVNWPYVYAAMGPDTDNVSFRDTDLGFTIYPRTLAGRASAPPFGGIEIGVGSYSSHKDAAWAAVQCITSPEHQTEYMVNSGNPSATTTSYTDPNVLKAFPNGIAATILQSLQIAVPRPQTQYYGDLSTAIQTSFSPPQSVNQGTPAKAQTFAEQVLKGEKLL